VTGRRGVGRRTVAAVLAGSGYPVVPGDQRPELSVHVVAEVCKPEDRRALDSGGVDGRVDFVVVTKADVTATAPRLAAEITAATGVPAAPLAGLVALAAVDAGVVDGAVLDALRTLADAPADMSSPDAFVAAPHVLTPALRRRLVTGLGLVGIAHGVLTLRDEPRADAARLRAVFRAVSGLDRVLDGLDGAAAPARYRRLVDAGAQLEARAVTDPDAAALADSDEVVLARMRAAHDVLTAAGLPTGPVGAHRAHAVRWRRYADGPVSALHRQCGLDMARGALRLLAHSGHGEGA
jgi:hypothetical protein